MGGGGAGAQFCGVVSFGAFEQRLADVEVGEVSRDDALLTLVNGWMSHVGPVTASQLGVQVGLAASEIEKGLLRMEASGTVLRGKFTGRWLAGRAHAPPVELRSTGQPGAAVPTEAHSTPISLHTNTFHAKRD